MLLLHPIVWVDPDLDYTFVVRRAFMSARIENPIVCLTTGELAMSYLTGYGPSSDPSPLLIVIGSPLAGMSRLQLLAKLKERPRLASIPVVFLGPESEVEHAMLKQLGVAAVLKKSVVKDKIVSLVADIIATWLNKKPKD